MLLNRLRKTNENGYVEGGGFFVTALSIFGLIALALTLPNLIQNIGAVMIGNESISATQEELEVQGYVLSYTSVRDLVGDNDNNFLTKGGKGPEVTVTLENVGKEKVYLLVEKNGSVITPILKYASNDSPIASPKTLPKDSKETW